MGKILNTISRTMSPGCWAFLFLLGMAGVALLDSMCLEDVEYIPWYYWVIAVSVATVGAFFLHCNCRSDGGEEAQDIFALCGFIIGLGGTLLLLALAMGQPFPAETNQFLDCGGGDSHRWSYHTLYCNSREDEDMACLIDFWGEKSEKNPENFCPYPALLQKTVELELTATKVASV